MQSRLTGPLFPIKSFATFKFNYIRILLSFLSQNFSVLHWCLFISLLLFFENIYFLIILIELDKNWPKMRIAMWVAIFTAVAFGSFQNVHSLLSVDLTVVHSALPSGAVCLEGSPPAYHIDKGFGSGAQNWLLQIEGGAWCEDLVSCYLRSKTAYGSSQSMGTWNFSSILSNDPSMNPDFYNWNRVYLRYCDGASFAGDSEFNNGVRAGINKFITYH